MFQEKILIVEDEMIVAKDVEYIIESLGYISSGLASRWDDVIEIIQGPDKPTLVLMDVMLGEDTDGVELGKYVWDTYKIPVIFVSAYTDKTTIKRAKRANPFGYLRKPFDEKELFLAIEMARYKIKRYYKEKVESDWMALTIGVMDHGIITVNSDREVVFHNSAATALIGLTTSAIKGERIEDLFSFDIELDTLVDCADCGVKGVVTICQGKAENCLDFHFKEIKDKNRSGGVFTFYQS